MLQGILYPVGFINIALQFILLVWALYVSLRYFLSFKENPALLNITTLLVLMYVIYGSIYILFGEKYVIFNLGTSPSLHIYLQHALSSLLPIYLFYDYSRRKYLTESRIRLYFVLFILIYIALFWKNYNEMLIRAATLGEDRDEFTNNIGYRFLVLFPLLYFLNKKTVLQYAVMAILFLFILMGMKRGAIMIAGICFIFVIYHNWNNTKRIRNKLIIALSTLVLVSGVAYYVQTMLKTNDFFVYRIEQTLEGNTSGRDVIYSKIKTAILEEPSSLKLIFGHGANYTIAVAGNFAHQDWLEIACNNGLIGVTIFALFFIVFYVSVLKSKRTCPKYIHNAFFILFFICFTKSMFSMSIQSMEIGQTLLLGYFSYRLNCKNI